MILVTGGAGFIGSNFVLDWIATESTPVVNLDKLTYAGNLHNLSSLKNSSKHIFVHGDIGDRTLVSQLLVQHRPRAIVHFAAESHVDRSIYGPEDFILTNVLGTFHLLEEARAHWQKLPEPEQAAFRFLHVSTDEVYGSLEPDEAPFIETSRYAPNSPYAASKAGADHLVRAYCRTYGLPVMVTNCSNNYGPYQFPEKLIPLMILNALQGKPLPVYGDGMNVRDWLYVGDHCASIRAVLARGRVGKMYNIGGGSEKTNLEVVKTVCGILDELRPLVPHPITQSPGHPSPITHYSSLITFVKDRPGHDRRYAMDFSKISRELGWRPEESFETGIRKTVAWYLDNPDWVAEVMSGAYRRWIDTNYAGR
ncbi:MAG TPA: dTDP-glucose 4,6-dehydratase [Burkholderiales bacterium]|nr:dTDP-glucose 4,6-dehydratase [Burkholderiales bacterium]